jgi:hypothetical protein
MRGLRWARKETEASSSERDSSMKQENFPWSDANYIPYNEEYKKLNSLYWRLKTCIL